MGRPTKYDADTILDACLAMALERGPSEFTVAGIARKMHAPSGSIYHRFSGKDVLIGTLWLRAVERFQDGFLEAVSVEDPLTAAVSAATHVVRWSRNDLDHARLLLVYRSADFLSSGWPEELQHRNEIQRSAVTTAMRKLTKRLGATHADGRARVRFAVTSVPYGAVRPALVAGRRPETRVEQLVEETALALLTPLVRGGDCR